MVYFCILITAISCVIGNFIYQWVGDRNWEVAFERTFFQLVACVIMAGTYWNAARVAM